jgi:hypothetical protein
LLRCLATDNPEKWTAHLPAVCNALNNAYNVTTKTSPNVLVFGKQTRTLFDIDLSSTTRLSDHLQNLFELQEYASEQAWSNTITYNIKDKIEHDKNIKESDLQVGQLVYWIKPQEDPQKSYKLQERAQGPFIVINIQNNWAKLKHLTEHKILPNKINISQLKFPKYHPFNLQE